MHGIDTSTEASSDFKQSAGTVCSLSTQCRLTCELEGEITNLSTIAIAQQKKEQLATPYSRT